MPTKSAGGLVSGVFVSSLNVTALIETCLCKGLPSDAAMNGTQVCALIFFHVALALNNPSQLGLATSLSPEYHKQGLQAAGITGGAALLVPGGTTVPRAVRFCALAAALISTSAPKVTAIISFIFIGISFLVQKRY